MTTRAEATAAPGEVTIGDKTYRMSPLTDRDIGELDNWIQAKSLRIARESIPKDASTDEYNRMITAAMVGIQSLTMSSTRGAAVMASVDGLARALWQGIHPHHPDVTVDDVASALYTAKDIGSAAFDFKRVNHFGSSKKKRRQKDKKRKRNRKNRRAR